MTDLPYWDSDTERELYADACRKNFWNFLLYAFGVALNPEGAWLDPSVHKPLCDWLDKIIKEWELSQEQEFILIDAVRDSGKTVIVTKALTAWIQLRNPDMSSLISSVTNDKSVEFAEVIKKLWEGKDGYAYWPWLYNIWEDPETWTKSRFTHRARKVNISEASIETCSVETGKTGGHPRHVVVDDPITLEKLREAGNWIMLSRKHIASLYPVAKKNALFIICATPYEDGDVVTGLCMREDGIKEVIGHPLPKEYQRYVDLENGRWKMYHMPGATDEGKPLVPTCWPQGRIDYFKKKHLPLFASQVLLRPGSGEKVPLTLEQIEGYRIKRKDVPANLTYTIHCDTAFKNKKSANSGDESVIEVWGHHPDNGDVYFMEGHGSNAWRPEEFTDILISLAQRYISNRRRIRWITDEIVAGKEGVWETHLRSCFSNAGMWLPPYKEFDRRTGPRKEQRIRIAAAYWVDGHVYLCEDAPGLDNLIWQMARIGVSEHDDWADAGADVFHPEIYRPFHHNIDTDQPPSPRRPGDDRLKDGGVSDDQARWYYDQRYHDLPHRAREPIR